MKGNLLYSKPTFIHYTEFIHLYIIQKHLGWCLANNSTPYPSQVDTLRLTITDGYQGIQQYLQINCCQASKCQQTMLSLEKCSYLSLYYILFVNLVFVCFSNIDNMEPVEVSVSFSHLDQVIFKVSRFKTTTAFEKNMRFLIQMFYKDKAPSGKDNHLVYTYKKECFKIFTNKYC